MGAATAADAAQATAKLEAGAQQGAEEDDWPQGEAMDNDDLDDDDLEALQQQSWVREEDLIQEED